MTLEELEREAEEQAKKLEENQTLGVYDSDEDLEYDKGWNAGEVSGFKDGYIAGAKAREKRTAELKVQIEKMKCCTNCKYYSMQYLPYCCTKKRTCTHCTERCDEWEIKEND